MFLRRYSILFLTFSLLLLSIAFGVVAQGEPVTIDFYFPEGSANNSQAIFERYAAMFNETHPDIKINIVYNGSYTQTRDTIQTEIAAGDVVVDVAVMLATDLISFVEDETIVPIQDLIDQMEDPEAYVSDFFPALWDNSTDEEGTIWSIPFQRSTPIMFYNADLLAAEGIEVPKNNEELLAAAQQLTTPERAGLLMPVAGTFPIWIFQSFAAAYGQPIVDENPAAVYLNTPEALAALEYITRLGTEYKVGPAGGSAWGDTPTAFINGQAAMIYHTTGSLTRILNDVAASANPFEVGVAFLPSGPAGEDGTGYGAPTGGGNLYIFSSSTPEEQAAAWEWVQFLSSPEIQADWGASTGYIAVRISAWELDPLKSLADEYPQYYIARDQLEYASKEFSSYRSIDVQNIINTALSNVISGAVPLDQAASVLEQAQAQIDSLLADYQ